MVTAPLQTDPGRLKATSRRLLLVSPVAGPAVSRAMGVLARRPRRRRYDRLREQQLQQPPRRVIAADADEMKRHWRPSSGIACQ